MKILTSFLLAALAAACAFPLAAKVATNYLPRTGDAALDADLVSLDEAARTRHDALIDAMVSELGSPRYLLRDYLGPKRWAPGDVYCACAIAYQLQRPCAEILREYEPHRSEGWRAFVRRYDLLPGSAGYVALTQRIGQAKANLAPRPETAGDATPAKDEKR